MIMIEQAIQKIKEVQKRHAIEERTIDNEYIAGIYDGLEYAIAIIEDRSPNIINQTKSDDDLVVDE